MSTIDSRAIDESSATDTLFFEMPLSGRDPAVFGAITEELERQKDQIELIASENIVSRAVLEAQGSVLTNKYAEGYPGRRYYGGCEFVDKAEALAIERACTLFGCNFANVQPHSGAQANQAVMLALLEPGDTIMGLSLDAGGHLTHGAPPNLSGKWFKAVTYGVRKEDALIDYDQVKRLAEDHKPKLIIAGGSAYPRQIDFRRFREIADSVGAYFHVDMAHFAGLVAGGAHPSPLPDAHVVTTTTHKTLRGPRGGMILSNDPVLGKKFNSAVFPGLQGGPLMHVIAAKAVAFAEALTPDFKTYSRQVVENAKALGEVLKGGNGYRFWRYRHACSARRSASKEADRQCCRSCFGTGRYHLQQKRSAVRSRKADDHVRDSPWYACRDHTRLWRGGIPEIGNLIGDVLDATGQNSDQSSRTENTVREQVRVLCDRFPIY